MTKLTTPGALLIKSMLPSEEAKGKFNLHRRIDKDGMKDLINILVEDKSPRSSEIINELGKMFFNKATEIGATTPLSDYENDSTERQAAFSELETKVADILKKGLPKLEQAKEISLAAAGVADKFKRDNLEYMLSRSSTAARMAASGARGNAAQLQQATASPLMAVDVKGIPLPVVIRHSFGEGLSNAEHLAMSYGGRASTVLTQLSTEKPGALFKRLTPTVFHEIITEADCGSKTGVPLKVADRLTCIGRYEAGTNKLIDPTYYKELQASGQKTIVARSPLTCKAQEGICQKCYGLSANGELPNIGQNMGVIAAQSVSEVLTQAMLSTKHQGGVVGRVRNPFEEADNLLGNPENFQDEATISQVNGKVNSMHQTSLKDWEVDVSGTKHFIPNIQEPSVKIGDRVRVGDPISSGTINPRELVTIKGAGAGRIYLADKMRQIYSRNAQLDPRHFDIIARNMIKHVEVMDPGESGFLPGDKVEVGKVSHYLLDHSTPTPVGQAVGKTLAGNTLDLTPGTVLTQNHVDDLIDHGVTTIPVSTSNLVVRPLVPGLQSLKLLDKNWVSKLSFNRLHKTIQEAAALGQSSPTHGPEPITPYVIGNEFGEGDNGRY